MAIQFTPAQHKVLDAREHNILVSAAAGSGKTAVLVERIVRLVSEGEQPPDIDRLLVVTFTRAAAAQMRERIGRALSARLALDPSNAHLQRQEILLHNAQITTMDSFFTFLLRNYFSDIDLDPGFRQIDPTESRILAAEVLQDFLEEKYAAGDPAFLRCVTYFCPGADDSPLEELILELCIKAGSHPSPQAWLGERAFDYDVRDEKALFSTVWMRSMVLRTADYLIEAGLRYEAMKEICQRPGGPDVCHDFLEEERKGLVREIGTLRKELEQVLREPSEAGPADGEEPCEDPAGEDTREFILFRKIWEEIQLSLQWSFPRYPAIRGKKYDYIDSGLRDAVKSMRDAQKDGIVRLKASAGGQSPERILAMMECAREPMQTLSALAAEYWDRFLEVKRDRHLIDFVDLEHFALDILAERQEDGSYVPRRAARALKRHYAEILIDEYQDSNEVQELLLQIISGEDEGHNNRFMVGDIKQSIYRFRLARPEIFMEKYDTYRPDDPCTERIELDQNFRSRSQVLDCVNSLFMRIMRREVGGVAYDENVSLKKGAVFPDEVPSEISGRTPDNSLSEIPGRIPDNSQAEINSRAEVSGQISGGTESKTAGETAPREEAGQQDSDPYCAELLLLETGPVNDSGNGEMSGAIHGAQAGGAGLSARESDEEQEDTEEEDGLVSLSGEIGALSNRQKEALLIAGRIRQMVGTLPVRDDVTGGRRPARYGDIVVLLRSTVGWNEDLRAVFDREGIPAYAESRTGYFAAQEIREIIEMLRVLDNPRQDIPLYGALRGYFGGFTQDEIAVIRLACREGMLFDALLAAAGEADGTEESSVIESGGTEESSAGESDGTEGLLVGESEGTEAAAAAAGAASGRRAEEGVFVSESLAQKCASFLSFLRSWRRCVQYRPVSEIVTGLLEETGFQDYCTALPGGAQRSANLRFLRSQADAFTRTDLTGLFQFLRYIEGLHRQEIDYGEANTLDENADVVRIMSIHKSKGLEFPICFVSGLSKSFSFRRFDVSGQMIYDGDWGAGINYFDPVSRVSSTTLRREEIAEKIRRDCMGEELRVLYVALTRAKEKLIMTASMKGFARKILDWNAAMAGFFHDQNARTLSPSMIAGASSFAQLICQAVMAQAGPGFVFDAPADEGNLRNLSVRIRMCTQNDLTMQALEEQADLSRCEKILRDMEGHSLDAQPDPAAARELASWLFSAYPHEELRGLYAQTSVSELKRRAMRTPASSEGGTQESPGELFPESVPVPYLPAFLRKQEQDSPVSSESAETAEAVAGTDAAAGARRGTAFHRVLELMDYEHRGRWITEGTQGRGKLEEWLNALPDTGKITKEEAALVSVSRLMHFLRSPLAGRMAEAQKEGRLFREQPFVMGCPADEVSEGLPHDEMVTVQGIIDAFLIEEGSIILVDYKTDRVRGAGELISRYRVQLNLYAEALQKAFGLPVAQKLIYSTALGGEISV